MTEFSFEDARPSGTSFSFDDAQSGGASFSFDEAVSPNPAVVGATTNDSSIDDIVPEMLGSKKVGAAVIGLGKGMLDTWRGAKQLLNKIGLVDDETIEKYRDDDRQYRKLRESKYGGYATGGEVVGLIADPVAIAAPAAKGKTIWDMAKAGVKYGGLFGALGYVDEEAGQTRLKNTAFGALGGGVALPAIGGVTNLSRAARGKPLIPLVERQSADFAIKAGVVPEPKAGKVAEDVLPIADDTPNPAIKVKESVAENLTPVESAKLNDSGIKLYSNPLDPELVGGAGRRVAGAYQKYFGDPALELVRRNPGSSLGAVTGGLTGWNTAEDDAPITEKLGRAAAGAVLGFGAAKGIGSVKVGDRSIGDWVSRGVIDNFGLPNDYVKIRKLTSANRNHIASQFVELAKEAADLPADGRAVLYNALQGEAIAPDSLMPLSGKTRDTITRFGQQMVDLGLLDPEVFAKNVDTYVHRSYAPKLGQGKYHGVARKIRALGNELKPRGIFKDVPESEAAKWADQGWEVFGKPKSGKQRVRWQLTKEQRVKLGEIEDAAFAIAETGRLMSNDIAVFKFYDDVAKNFASDVDAAGMVKIQEGKISKTSVNKFGNLEGKYVPEEIYNDLKWTHGFKQIMDHPAIKWYRKTNQYWKLSKTALNPTVHVNNVMSNILLYDAADAKYKNLAESGVEMFRYAKGKETKYIKKAIDLGVFDADFASNELKSIKGEWFDAHMAIGDISKDPIGEGIGLVRKAWRHSGGTLTDLYQKEDHWFRLGVFIDRMKKGASAEDAALEARRWFIDYDINAPFVQMMRESFTPFIAYSYRVTPLLAETALLRPWKFAKWAAIGYGLNMVGERFGPGDPKKERSLLINRQKGNLFGLPFMPPQMMKMPTDFGTGVPQYLDVTRWIPGGDVFDTTEEGAAIPFLPGPVQPSMGAAGSVAQTFFGYDAFKKRELEGLGVGASDTERNVNDLKVRGKFLVQQFAPNFPGIPGSYSTEKITRAARGVETPLGDRLPVWQATLQSFGIKIRPADVEKMTLRVKYDAKKKVEAVKQKQFRAAMDYKSGAIDREQYIQITEENREIAQKIVDAMNKKVR